MKRLRAREIARLFTTEGKGVKELAEMFGVSSRTVQRDLRMGRGSSRGDKDRQGNARKGTACRAPTRDRLREGGKNDCLAMTTWERKE